MKNKTQHIELFHLMSNLPRGNIQDTPYNEYCIAMLNDRSQSYSCLAYPRIMFHPTTTFFQSQHASHVPSESPCIFSVFALAIHVYKSIVHEDIQVITTYNCMVVY